MSSLPIAYSTQIELAAGFIRDRWSPSPDFAIILGTGAGKLADEIEVETTIDYGEIPHFPRSTAMGHKGQWVCGRLGGVPVYAMQGRFHLYEGYSVDAATLPIHVMHQLGVNTIFVSNASGGINPKFASGQIMLIESHLDFMFRTSPWMIGQGLPREKLVLEGLQLFDGKESQRRFGEERQGHLGKGRPVGIRRDGNHEKRVEVLEKPYDNRSDCYSRALIDQALACGRRNGFSVQQGVYAAMLGPNYETRAEYRFLRRIGADVAGMSTVPEVTVAARYRMNVLGLSVVTNIAKPDVLEATSGQEVIDAAETAAPHLKAIVVDAIEANATSIQ